MLGRSGLHGAGGLWRWGHSGKKPPILPEQAADFARIPVPSDDGLPPKEQMLSLRPDFLFAYGDYGGSTRG